MLRPLQERFNAQDYPDLIVGLAQPDDAAVWRLGEARLLVMTTDFFTPVVDNPYHYGLIAAANALSDVYAMGAEPFLALNIACLPVDLPADITSEIVRGLADKVKEAGAVIAGGHTIQDEEPKVGLVALGFADEGHLMTKAKAEVGDKLVLTKPLGMGVTTTAVKADRATQSDIDQAVDWMQRLNGRAASIAKEAGVKAATDVTGFGLIGHAIELADASGVRLRIDAPSVPLIAGAQNYASRGFIPGGTNDNRAYWANQVDFEGTIPEPWPTLLFDAQTSGGLLLAVADDQLDPFLTKSKEQGQSAWVIGQVERGQGLRVTAQGNPRSSGVSEVDITFLAA